jgi:hypothetical protein
MPAGVAAARRQATPTDGALRTVAVFIAYPWLALGAGGAFVALWRWRRARSAMVAGLLWCAYGGYEYLMHARVLCSGECNIRVDLLAIYPLLLAMSIAALWNSTRGRRTSSRT